VVYNKLEGKSILEFNIGTTKFSTKINVNNLTKEEIGLILLELEMQINEKHFSIDLPNKGKFTLATRIHISELKKVV